jgi:hypothetical protein
LPLLSINDNYFYIIVGIGIVNDIQVLHLLNIQIIEHFLLLKTSDSEELLKSRIIRLDSSIRQLNHVYWWGTNFRYDSFVLQLEIKVLHHFIRDAARLAKADACRSKNSCCLIVSPVIQSL